MQALISLMTILGCVIFIVQKIELEWTKNILVMIISVWVPSPFIRGRREPEIISQNANNYQALGTGGAIERRWSFLSPLQGKVQGGQEDKCRNDEKSSNEKE